MKDKSSEKLSFEIDKKNLSILKGKIRKCKSVNEIKEIVNGWE